MSDSTWLYYPFPSLGWSFGNTVLPRFVSMWQEMFEKTYEWFHWLFAWKWFHGQDWCFNHTLRYFCHNIARTDFTPVNRSGRARAGDAFYYFNDASCRPVTSAHESWPRRSPYRHGAPSPSFVLRYRALTAASSFVLPPSRLPTPAGRRGHVRAAVLPPRFSHATSVRYWHIPSDILPNNNNKLSSVGTFIPIVVFSSEAQHRTVSRSQSLQHKVFVSRSRKPWLSSSVSEAMDAFVRERY